MTVSQDLVRHFVALGRRGQGTETTHSDARAASASPPSPFARALAVSVTKRRCCSYDAGGTELQAAWAGENPDE